ncbi:MAG: hypothetical protein LBJ96_00710 [Holosporaceae bacterium]|jgi:hypothetical protein|nr:hypothetical protein [Holosporaceae bacterium]
MTLKKTVLLGLMGIFLMTETSEARWHPIYMKGIIALFKNEPYAKPDANGFTGYRKYARYAAALLYTADGNSKLKELVEEGKGNLGNLVPNIESKVQSFRKVSNVFNTTYAKVERTPEEEARLNGYAKKKALSDIDKTDRAELGKKLKPGTKAETMRELEQKKTEASQALEKSCESAVASILFSVHPATGGLQAVTNLGGHAAKIFTQQTKVTTLRKDYEFICKLIHTIHSSSDDDDAVAKIGAVPAPPEKELRTLLTIVQKSIESRCNRAEICKILMAFLLEVADDPQDLQSLNKVVDDNLYVANVGTTIAGWIADPATMPKYTTLAEARNDIADIAEDTIFSPYSGRPVSQSVIPYDSLKPGATNTAYPDKKSLPDCVETALRHTASILLLKKEGNKFTFHQVKATATAKAFFDVHTDPLEASLSNNIAIFADWGKLFVLQTGTSNISYETELQSSGTSYGAEVKSSVQNFAHALIKIFDINSITDPDIAAATDKDKIEALYKRIFEGINSEKEYEINAENITPAGDFADLIVTTKRKDNTNELSKFKIHIIQNHSEVQDCQTFVDNF